MKPLKLFNFLTDKLELFTPKDPNDVKIYACGPTVYDSPHLGHARTYIFVDCLRRILQHYLGYGVRFVMNVTDLDDKIIERGGDIARPYEREFFETMNKLNVEKAHFVARVTDNMEVIKDFVWNGLDGFTYTRNSSDLHFKSKEYRKGRVFPNLNVDSSHEEDPRDFVLWKSKVWSDHDSMPGWHSECAAIAANEFGNHIDLLVGGIDLKFPHHENQITLGQIYFSEDSWVKYCLYTGHLEIKGRKMSKSLKNFTTINQVLDKGISPLAIRFMFMQHNYSKPMHFSEDEMVRSQKRYHLIMHHIKSIQQYLLEPTHNQELDKIELEVLLQVKKKMDDLILQNLNIPAAIDTIEEFIKRLSKKKENGHQALKYSFQYCLWIMDSCFGLMNPPKIERRDGQLLHLIKKFRLDVREHALGKGEQALLNLCDTTRKELIEIGYVVEDSTT